MEPLYEGEPILAVAAVDELTAAEAIEEIEIEFEPLPFVVDPIESLRPGSPNARAQGNVWMRPPRRRRRRRSAAQRRGRRQRRRAQRRATAGSSAAAAQAAPAQARRRPGSGRSRGAARRRQRRRPPQIVELKWTDEDFAAAGDGQLPLGKHTDEWLFGDVEAGFKEADLVLDETFVGQNTSHQPLETRTAMAYWQNGKLYLHGSHAEHGADRRRRSRAGSASPPSRRRAHQRVHRRRLRQQDSRAPSRWRFRRCSRRRPTRR